MLAACGYKTKKDLKAAVGKPFNHTEMSMFGAEYKPDGNLTVVGPEPHVRKWYAIVLMKDGLIVKVS